MRVGRARQFSAMLHTQQRQLDSDDDDERDEEEEDFSDGEEEVSPYRRHGSTLALGDDEDLSDGEEEEEEEEEGEEGEEEEGEEEGEEEEEEEGEEEEDDGEDVDETWLSGSFSEDPRRVLDVDGSVHRAAQAIAARIARMQTSSAHMSTFRSLLAEAPPNPVLSLLTPDRQGDGEGGEGDAGGQATQPPLAVNDAKAFPKLLRRCALASSAALRLVLLQRAAVTAFVRCVCNACGRICLCVWGHWSTGL